MSSVVRVVWYAFVLVTTLSCSRTPAPELTDIGPRVVSNQTSQPLALVGRNFVPGMQLTIGDPFSRTLPVTTIDATHAYTRLPRDLTFQPASDAAAVRVSLVGQTAHPVLLRIVNDAAFPDITMLVATGSTLFAASSTTDKLYRIPMDTLRPTALDAGDGPSALAVIADGDGTPRLAIAHAWEPTIWICDATTGVKLRVIPAPAYASALTADGDALVVAEQARDTVRRIAIADGTEVWRRAVDPNPKSLSMTDEAVAVGSALTGRVELLDKHTGEPRAVIAPTPATRIVGGHTEAFARYIMGGKGERALAWLGKARKLLVASIGPNIGPNPEKMEVSMNGGVGVIDPTAKAFTTHLGFGFGTPEAIVVDEGQSVAYISDIGAGLVRVVDLERLQSNDDKVVRTATLWSVPILPTPGFPLTRQVGDFAVNNRSGVELHSGPHALALAADGDTLYVANRFSGSIAAIDVTAVKTRTPSVKTQHLIVDTLEQRERRLGQVLYFTDLGRTGMSCEACHLEGHGDGVLFEKTVPLRIYRNPTVRGTGETPPYFTPASTFSIAETIRKVGDRNRFQNPAQTVDEVKRLTSFTNELVTLANPFVGDDGAPPEALELPDGHLGHPRDGLKVFEAKCASCHPAPYFTQDQATATRNHYLDVGTPHLLPLREDQQSPRFEGMAIPALIGAWDVWPMLNSGAAGFTVDPAKGMLEVSDRFALRAVVSRFSGHEHGNAESCTVSEVDDLLAYLMTL